MLSSLKSRGGGGLRVSAKFFWGGYLGLSENLGRSIFRVLLHFYVTIFGPYPLPPPPVCIYILTILIWYQRVASPYLFGYAEPFGPKKTCRRTPKTINFFSRILYALYNQPFTFWIHKVNLQKVSFTIFLPFTWLANDSSGERSEFCRIGTSFAAAVKIPTLRKPLSSKNKNQIHHHHRSSISS